MAAARQAERLDRGAVAVPAAGGGRLVTWRLLGNDDPGVHFVVERDGQALTPEPQALTQWLDTEPRPAGHTPRYRVISLQGGTRTTAEALLLNQPYLHLPLATPPDHVAADGSRHAYEANDGAPADLDGDGRYEIVIKWQPANAKDNSQAGQTGPTLLDAYSLNGQHLWRINLGPNVRSGAHYTPFVVYDFDGDGRAELMVRTADGTVDGTGRVLADAAARHANERGYVLQGAEFITVFDGRNGAALASAPYVPERGRVADWGDSYGNRVDRFLAGVAYLDGQRPSAVFTRGYYTRAVLAAWDWRGGRLSQRWVFDSDAGETNNRAAREQGAHWFAVTDVDGDGRDHIVYGAATLSPDGRLRYSTGLGHGDALHVGQLDPALPGRQVFMVHETPKAYGAHGVEMHDAASGRLLWSGPGQNTDVGRGVCMDIDPTHRGVECWASVGPLYGAQGQVMEFIKIEPVDFETVTGIALSNTPATNCRAKPADQHRQLCGGLCGQRVWPQGLHKPVDGN